MMGVVTWRACAQPIVSLFLQGGWGFFYPTNTHEI